MNEVNLVSHLLTPLVLVYLLLHALIFMVRQYPIIDIPNSRSLHDAPTPTAGGVVIALILTGWLLYQGNTFLDAYALAWVGLGFAILGGWDDIAPKSVLFRVFFQLLLALFFVYLVFEVTLFHLLVLILVLAIISVVNIFNFMDGADGFAGTQAALFVLSNIFFFDQINLDSYTPYMTVLLGCIFGFLLLNTRNPAQIFMGDVGSYFMGFHIVVIGILGVRSGLSICVPLLLFAPFIVDSSLTLGARIFSGQSWWQAHRSHLYQKLILAGATPRKVTFKLLLLNCFYCWPAAWMAHTYQAYSLLIMSGVYVSLSLVWYYLRKRYI